jgi:hypothetical protein
MIVAGHRRDQRTLTQNPTNAYLHARTVGDGRQLTHLAYAAHICRNLGPTGAVKKRGVSRKYSTVHGRSLTIPPTVALSRLGKPASPHASRVTILPGGSTGTSVDPMDSGKRRKAIPVLTANPTQLVRRGFTVTLRILRTVTNIRLNAPSTPYTIIQTHRMCAQSIARVDLLATNARILIHRTTKEMLSTIAKLTGTGHWQLKALGLRA